MSAPDLSAPIRAAIVADATITAQLPAYLGGYPVFTRVPVPDDAPYPLIVIHEQMNVDSEDGVADQRPTFVRDVTAYGRNDTAAHFEQVRTIAFAVRELLHRQRTAFAVAGWSVIDVTVRGPSPAPVDDEQTVARRVEVSVRLARKNS